MLTSVVAVPSSSRPLDSAPTGFAGDGSQFLAGIRELPGVTRVFPASTGISRWFTGPLSAVIEDGPSVRAWVTVGIDRHHTSAGVIGLVGAYLVARLSESGFDFIEVRVRVALLS